MVVNLLLTYVYFCKILDRFEMKISDSMDSFCLLTLPIQF